MHQITHRIGRLLAGIEHLIHLFDDRHFDCQPLRQSVQRAGVAHAFSHRASRPDDLLQSLAGGYLQTHRTVAEGVRNTRVLHALAQRLGVEMPIVEQMYQVLYGSKKPAEAVRDLMQRSLKPEAG